MEPIPVNGTPLKNVDPELAAEMAERYPNEEFIRPNNLPSFNANKGNKVNNGNKVNKVNGGRRTRKDRKERKSRKQRKQSKSRKQRKQRKH